MPPLFKKDPRFIQGIFRPKNPQKFIGKVAIFRSSYERKFFLWADQNPNVLEWGSENIVIPYKSPIDERMHRYYVDNYVVIKEGEQIKKYLIEIKPFSQTQPPKISKRKKKATIQYEVTQWAVNKAKWEAAKKFAASRNAEFLLLTEKNLFKTE
jgi:hypothetical protein